MYLFGIYSFFLDILRFMMKRWGSYILVIDNCMVSFFFIFFDKVYKFKVN